MRLELAYLERGKREKIVGCQARREIIKKTFDYCRLKGMGFWASYRNVRSMLVARYRFVKDNKKEISYTTLLSDIKRLQAGEVE